MTFTFLGMHAEPHPVLDGAWIVAMPDGTVRYVFADTATQALRHAVNTEPEE